MVGLHKVTVGKQEQQRRKKTYHIVAMPSMSKNAKRAKPQTVFQSLQSLLQLKPRRSAKYCTTCPTATNLSQSTSKEAQKRQRAQCVCELCESPICMKCRKRCEKCKRGVCRDCCDTGFLCASKCKLCDPEAVRRSKENKDDEEEEQEGEGQEEEVRVRGPVTRQKSITGALSSIAASLRYTSNENSNINVEESFSADEKSPNDDRCPADPIDPRFDEFCRSFQSMISKSKSERDKRLYLNIMWFLLTEQERERYSEKFRKEKENALKHGISARIAEKQQATQGRKLVRAAKSSISGKNESTTLDSTPSVDQICDNKEAIDTACSAKSNETKQLKRARDDADDSRFTEVTNHFLTPFQRMCREQYPILKQRHKGMHLLEHVKLLARIWDRLPINEKKKYMIPTAEELRTYGHELLEHVEVELLPINPLCHNTSALTTPGRMKVVKSLNTSSVTKKPFEQSSLVATPDSPCSPDTPFANLIEASGGAEASPKKRRKVDV